jgi:FkbM family methyltransferase
MFMLRRLRRITSPPYFFQPLQILKRFRLEYLSRTRKEAVVVLPWGLPIRINLHEAVGSNIAREGLYEVDVTETLWRLTEPGDLAIDAGANIGYTTSILGVRVGPKGRVQSFEPHPQVFESLEENVANWKKDPRCGSFVLHKAALGNVTGKALLHTGDWFRTNRGTAWISEDVEPAPDRQVIEVPIHNLDSLLGEYENIGILKMDVQGYELSILKGMAHLLERRAVRDIVFEEEAPFPAPTHEYLKSYGYSIFGIQGFFAGVRGLPDAQPSFDPEFGPAPNYLATRDVARAQALLKPLLWRSFGFVRLLVRR